MGCADTGDGTGLRGLSVPAPAEPVFYSADQFWDILQRHGLEIDGDYAADGGSRFCKCPDGRLVVISVHDETPDYIVDRILRETGCLPPPSYEHLN